MSLAGRLGQARDQGGQDFESFYRSYLPRLIRFLIIDGAPAAAAAEAAQDAMSDLYRCWDSVRSPIPWVRKAGTRWSHQHRARGSRDLLPAELPEPEPLMSTKAAEEMETNSDFLRLLEVLTPRQREVLAYSYDGDTTAEIAETLGIKESTVRATVRDARRRMAEHRRSRMEGWDE